jgi:hypothetical protein
MLVLMLSCYYCHMPCARLPLAFCLLLLALRSSTPSFNNNKELQITCVVCRRK